MTDTPTIAGRPAPEPVMNRRRRGVLGGAILVAVGVTYLLPSFGVPNAASYLFVALGAAFAIAYVTSLQPYVYLVPAGTLTGFGVGLLIPQWFGLPPEAVAPVFLACLTVGLLAVFIIRPQRRWPLIPAAIFGLIAIIAMFGVANVIPPGLQPLFVPAALIAVGGYLILAPRL